MTDAPLVSIITPYLNSEKFMEETVESVIAQTYENWELLLVDDGSSDGSPAIALQYAKRYPGKVRYLEHGQRRNLGQSASRNLGIRHARGSYVAFLDADDVYLPQKLERQVAILEAHPEAGMVYGASYYWYSWSGNPRQSRWDRKAPLGVRPEALYSPPTLLAKYLRHGGVVPCICGLMLRRQVAEDIGGFEDVIHRMYEDQVLLAKICLAVPVYVESGCWDKYRQHIDSTSQQAISARQYHPSEPNQSRLAYLLWLENYISARNIQYPALWEALHDAMWPYRHPRLYELTSPIRWLTHKMQRVTRRIRRLTGK